MEDKFQCSYPKPAKLCLIQIIIFSYTFLIIADTIKIRYQSNMLTRYPGHRSSAPLLSWSRVPKKFMDLIKYDKINLYLSLSFTGWGSLIFEIEDGIFFR